MEDKEQEMHENLERGLKNRHIQLIGLGGAIGVGLFLGSATAIEHAVCHRRHCDLFHHACAR